MFGLIMVDEVDSNVKAVTWVAFASGFAILPVWGFGVAGFAVLFADVLMPFWAFWALLAAFATVLVGITCLLVRIPSRVEEMIVFNEDDIS